MNWQILNSALLLLVFAAGQAAATDDSGKQSDPQSAAKPEIAKQGKQLADRAKRPDMPVYVPPMRGAPAARVGGGTRGTGDSLPYISVLSPEHTGYSSTPQPVLYWYLSEPVDTRFEFALVNDDDIDPVFEIVLERAMQQGFNYLDLSEHGVSLVPGPVYQWSVALVGDPNMRSSDIVSSGTIQLVEPGKAQQAQLGESDGYEAVVIYAREGYWYDAFTGLTRLIEKDPGNTGLLQTRSDLLRQVGLDTVADAGQ